MDELLQAACAAIQVRYNADLQEFRGEYTLFLTPETVVDAAQTLRDEFTFEMLMDVTAVDYWPQQEPRFHLVYQFYSLNHHLRLQFRVPLDGNAPSLPSLVGVYASANWREREVFDLMGIYFDDHPDLRRIMMPGDWEGHPLRKDHPLGYEEVQFTFNVDEINKRKRKPGRYEK
jgi:NADH-quinone oxidoreductase subunit C